MSNGNAKGVARFPVPRDLQFPAVDVVEVRVRNDGKEILKACKPGQWPADSPHLGLLWQRYLPSHDLKDEKLKSPAGVDFSALQSAHLSHERRKDQARRWHGFGVVQWYVAAADENARSQQYRRLLDKLHARRDTTLDAFGIDSRDYRVAQHMTVGMALPATVENSGIAVEHTYGFPIIPARSLKGLAWHYLAEEIGRCKPDETPAAEVAGTLLAETAGADRATVARLLELLLGNQEREGAVAFHDGWVLPGTSWFAPGVLTPHHLKYLSGDLPAVHLDRESPVPVHFLSVRRNVKFRLPLTLTSIGRCFPDDARIAMLAFTRRILDCALDEWGVGGRSGAGFGRLLPVSGGGKT